MSSTTPRSRLLEALLPVVELAHFHVPGHVAFAQNARPCTNYSGKPITQQLLDTNHTTTVLQDGDQGETSAQYQSAVVDVEMEGHAPVLQCADVPLVGEVLDAVRCATPGFNGDQTS